MFYVPELAGREDGDGPEWFDVVFEGVVPFNGRETYRRFTRDAFPAFLRMAIAAVGFDPRDENHGAHAWAAQVEHARTAGFAELPERERANLLKLLRRIWQVKYGTKRSQYPGFLNAQLAKSMSRLREMGWLMTKIERDAHQHAGHHYWTHCRGLLKDITGRDAASLADEYCAITLAREAETLMDSGDVGHILFYKLGQEYRGTQKVCVFSLLLTLISRMSWFSIGIPIPRYLCPLYGLYDIHVQYMLPLLEVPGYCACVQTRTNQPQSFLQSNPEAKQFSTARRRLQQRGTSWPDLSGPARD